MSTAAMSSPVPLKCRVKASATAPLPRSVSDLLWRRVHRDDIPEIVRLINACHAADAPWEVTVAGDLSFKFDETEVDLTQDSAIAFDPEGRAVAYAIGHHEQVP